MSPDVILTALNRRQFFSLDLRRLLDGLRHMTLALDSSDLGHVRVSINQSLVVLQLGPLTSTLDSTAVGGIGTPESDVAIVRSREDVLVVGGELGGEDTIKRLDSWFCKKVEERTKREHTAAFSAYDRCRANGHLLCSTNGPSGHTMPLPGLHPWD